MVVVVALLLRLLVLSSSLSMRLQGHVLATYPTSALGRELPQ